MRAASDGRGQGWNLLTEGGASSLDTLLRERGAVVAVAAHLIHASLVAADVMIIDAGSHALAGQEPILTRRERDCLAFVAEGLRVAELAHRLGVSEATVEFHLVNARRKFRCSDAGSCSCVGPACGGVLKEGLPSKRSRAETVALAAPQRHGRVERFDRSNSVPLRC